MFESVFCVEHAHEVVDVVDFSVLGLLLFFDDGSAVEADEAQQLAGDDRGVVSPETHGVACDHEHFETLEFDEAADCFVEAAEEVEGDVEGEEVREAFGELRWGERRVPRWLMLSRFAERFR